MGISIGLEKVFRGFEMDDRAHVMRFDLIVLDRHGQKLTGPIKPAEPNRAVRLSVLVLSKKGSVRCFIFKN